MLLLLLGIKSQRGKKKILAIQNELANVISHELKVRQQLYMSMIGPGGKHIQSIMIECNVQYSISFRRC